MGLNGARRAVLAPHAHHLTTCYLLPTTTYYLLLTYLLTYYLLLTTYYVPLLPIMPIICVMKAETSALLATPSPSPSIIVKNWSACPVRWYVGTFVSYQVHELVSG